MRSSCTHHQGIAFRTAYLIAGYAADAEEAAQDGFVKAHRRSGGSARARRSALAAADRRQRGAEPAALGRPARRRSRCEAAGDAARGTRPRPPRRRSSAGERREELLAALEPLERGAPLAVALPLLPRPSEEETAAVLGVRRGTVKSRLSRALERLRPSWERRACDRARAQGARRLDRLPGGAGPRSAGSRSAAPRRAAAPPRARGRPRGGAARDRGRIRRAAGPLGDPAFPPSPGSDDRAASTSCRR